MSELTYLEKLLDGVKVEWQTLGKVLKRTKGTKITAGQMKALHKDNAPLKIFAGGKTVAFVDFKDIPEKDINREPSIIVKSRGIIEFEYYDKPFSHKNEMWSYHSNNDAISIKYIYYFLKINEGYFQKIGGKMQMPQIATPDTDKFEVPIPCPDNPEKSLAIQSEIVRILDKFTALTAELTAELNMRKKQYNYYRDQLLSFDESSVEWKTLLEACDYVDYRGKTPKKTQSGIFLVTAKNIRMGYIDYHASQEFISEEDYAIVMRRGLPKKGDVLITTEAPCGFVAQVNRENIALAQRVIKYRSKNTQLSNSFLKHYLLGSQFQDKLMQAATGSTVKGIKGSRLHQLKIPIPSKVEQDRIVAILDKFDTLTNSITEGLPREIELRQKQYEYYRDLLFSFPKPETISN
ncbi:TPA: restriction endonuclease subunit S [Escherichia coli]|uniref:restriction endonuclease subunit S n=1 Tax=Klebsiella pneumoniae TaxID=573 RepID=UPI0021175D35|nr:restriction endonuclease subunit S [Klebsiella pneumoniae]MDJ8034944.1 restriction endonuclease subunit S [Salmonella enterica]HCN4665656.1 restriction endonuclease subunit S [Escherichia coli]MCQ8470244.1 restriction endonuclease subunit S [Klebsiella pneumoniae]MDJ8061271.1 restriction endonuclease subunit S [Salmonella enterica]HCN7146025.1 restriction endonuclease subunit S [Escherichia coli]